MADADAADGADTGVPPSPVDANGGLICNGRCRVPL